MKKFKLPKSYFNLLLLFVLTSTVCLGFKYKQYDDRVNYDVLEAGNVLLFVLSLICNWMHIKAMERDSPNAFVRSIQASFLLKLFVLVTATFVYVYITGSNRNAPAIFICMGLYVVYTVLEVRSAYQLVNKKNAKKNRTPA
ncbi:MAG: hypothetical protein QM610_13790 [Chitinophagaceae bacterium]